MPTIGLASRLSSMLPRLNSLQASPTSAQRPPLQLMRQAIRLSAVRSPQLPVSTHSSTLPPRNFPLQPTRTLAPPPPPPSPQQVSSPLPLRSRWATVARDSPQSVMVSLFSEVLVVVLLTSSLLQPPPVASSPTLLQRVVPSGLQPQPSTSLLLTPPALSRSRKAARAPLRSLATKFSIPTQPALKSSPRQLRPSLALRSRWPAVELSLVA